MKNQMKKSKIIALFMALCMVMSMSPITAYAGIFGDAFKEYDIGGYRSGTKDNDYIYNVIWAVTPDKSLTLAGSGKYRRSNYGDDGHYIYTAGPLFRVPNGCTLILKDNVVVTSETNPVISQPLIEVESGGRLIMEGNVSIERTSSPEKPAVVLHNGATFEMKGGYIQNVFSAVVVEDGATFTMTGGTIRNCSGNYDTSAVRVYGGSFTMSNATIDNCYAPWGGGIALFNSSTFSISNSTIKNCSATFGAAIYIAQNGATALPDLSTVTFGNNRSEYGDQAECDNVYFAGHHTANSRGPRPSYYIQIDYQNERISSVIPSLSLATLDGTNIPLGSSISDYIGQKILYRAFTGYDQVQYTVPGRQNINDGIVDKVHRTITLPVGYRYNTVSADLDDTHWVTVTSTTVLTLPADETNAIYIYKMATESAFRSNVITCTSRINITFNTGAGTACTSKFSYSGEMYGTLPNTTRTGYEMSGWYTAETGGKKITDYSIVESADDHTLYARWTPIKYTIKFNINGGNSGSMNNLTATYDQSVRLPQNGFTHGTAGTVFLAWSTNSNGTGTLYYNASQVKNLTSTKNATVTLYAVWSAVDVVNGYYQIGTAAQLMHFRDVVESNKYANGKLTASIDLSGIENWTPILKSGTSFGGYGGTFDGNNKTISNLKITDGGYCPNQYDSAFGLFGLVYGGTIKNLTLINVNVTLDKAMVGGIAGFLKGWGTIDNCSVKSGIIEGYQYIGGIVGRAGLYIPGQDVGGGNIKNCMNGAKITNSNYSGTRDVYAGGIAGGERYVNISNSCNMGEVYVKNGNKIGGITGLGTQYNYLTNCYNTGKVHGEGSWNIGAIAGYNSNNNNVTNCYWLKNDGEEGHGCTDIRYDDMKSDNFVNTLNNYITTQNDTSMRFWQKDMANINGGYPIYAPLSDEAGLSALTYSINGAEAIAIPDFNKDTKSYSISVPCNKGNVSVSFTPTVINNRATIASNTGANLAEGKNKATIEVKAESGSSTIYTVNILIAGHQFGDYVSNHDQTCSTDGTKTRTCTVCGYTETVTDEGSADGTTHTWGPYVYNNDATCTENGTWTSTCLECGAKRTITKYGSALGHTGGTATCTHRAVCERCGEEYGELAPHTHSGLVELQALNYYQDGIWEDRCTVCGALLERVVKPKLIDNSQPFGEITIGTNKWSEFLNGITFGLFFKETVSVTITGSDPESGLNKIYYYKSAREMSFSDLIALSSSEWTEGTNLSVSPKDTCIAYAKITDNVGNISFVNSEGIVVDDTPSTLNVVYPENGIWTSNENAIITVSAFDLVGELDTLKSVTYSINGGGEQVPPDIHNFVIKYLADGDYDVVVKATDQTDIVISKTVRVRKDTANPTLTLSGNTDVYKQNDTLHVTPNTGISGVKKVEVFKQGNDTATDITETYQEGYPISENGTYGVRVTNGAGEVAVDQITYTKIDTAKPVVQLSSNGYESGKWTTENVTLEISNSTANLGTTTFEYAVNGGSFQLYTGAIIVSEDTVGTTYKFRVTSQAGVIGDVASIVVKLDKTNPAGEITVEANKWTSFLNGITFGLFFKETQTVSITGSDDTSGIINIEYQIVEEENDFNENGEWTADDSFDIVPNKKAIIYARITDNAGLKTIINTNGLIVCKEPVVIDENTEFCTDSERSGYDDVVANLILNGHTLKDIFLGNSVLVKDEDYTVNAEGNIITFRKEYLANIVTGTAEFTLSFNTFYTDNADVTLPGTASFYITELIHAEIPTFISDLSEDDSASYQKGDTVADLMAEAEVNDDGEISYQWFCNGEKIEGATNKKYTPVTDKTGKYVYHCAATNTNNSVNGETTAATESKTAEIFVGFAQTEAPVIAKGAPQISMITDNEKLLEYALTDEDKANLDKGYNISVALKAELMENSLSESEKDSISNNLNGYSIGKNINISIVKTVVDEKGNINTTTVDTLTNAIKFMINIPDELKKSGRCFTVIRLHNGVTEVLEDSDTDPATITIESDRFSVYTLAYKDEVQKIPDTGERREWPYAVIMLMSGGVMLATLRKKRRKSADM